MIDRHFLVSATSTLSSFYRRWWHAFGCAILAILLSTSMATAGVVHSTGVQRVVDGPQGEVVVNGVLDTEGTPVQQFSQDFQSNTPVSQTKREKKPKEPNYNKIEYREQTLTTEETTTQESNGLLKLIIIGLLVLLIGLGIVYYVNNKRD